MTREEALNIKDEILKKEGSVYVCGIFKADGVVLINDMLDIINKHIEENEGINDKRRSNRETYRHS